jgi:hypothetical protein
MSRFDGLRARRATRREIFRKRERDDPRNGRKKSISARIDHQILILIVVRRFLITRDLGLHLFAFGGFCGARIELPVQFERTTTAKGKNTMAKKAKKAAPKKSSAKKKKK